MDGLQINRSLTLPFDEVQLRFSRSGGPGGQNVNTRETRVEAVFDVAASTALGPRQRERLLGRLAARLDSDGRLRVVASEERSQLQNRELALGRLQQILAEGLRPDPAPRRPTRPTRSAMVRRVAAKRARSQLKQGRRFVSDD